MLRRFLVIVFVVLASAIFVNSALSFGVATHLFVAERASEYQWDYLRLQSMYGAMAPDMNALAPREIAADLRQATHWDYEPVVENALLPIQKAFAAGWATHNEQWGADRYAHIDPGYVYDWKNDELIAFFKEKIPDLDAPDDELKYAAEAYIEYGIDLLLEDHDIFLGKKVTKAAVDRVETVPILLSKAYPQFVGEGLIATEGIFRTAMIAYGKVMSLPRPMDMKTASVYIALLYKSLFGESLTPEISYEFLEKAMELCEQDDYFSAVEEVIEQIINHENPQGAPAKPRFEPACATLWGEIKKAQ
jgi:hypothetical protein